MVEQVKSFLGMDLNALAKKHHDFTEGRQAELKTVISRCAKDFDFPSQRPYDTEHENFNYFALCLRNNVAINPILNGSSAVRENVLGFHY